VSFTMEISHPIPDGFTGGLGGPFIGTHAPADHWYIHFGNDLGALGGTDIVAAFDAHITKAIPHNPAADTPKVYGAQLFMRSPNDMMGAFFTHMTDIAPGIVAGASVSRGQRLGSVLEFPGTAAHLHLALVEILGGVPAGGVAPEANYRGFSLYDQFTMMGGGAVLSVTFTQDGNPPTVGGDGQVVQVVDFSSMAGIQRALALLGFDPGVIDGIDGPHTQAAVSAFQSQVLRLDMPTGVVDDETRTGVATALRNAGFQVIND
jgi:hypothetical protein